MIRTEINQYEEFSAKFKEYLESYLSKDCLVDYMHNNTLDVIVKGFENKFSFKIVQDGFYTPKLKVDIVFLIRKGSNFKLILIEAKYLNKLSLIDYSQLVGYLQVGKIIAIGLLLLIQKNYSPNYLSNDLSEIINLKKLLVNWTVETNKSEERLSFKTGILCYIPGNGIEWINTQDIHGFFSFENLVQHFGL